MESLGDAYKRLLAKEKGVTFVSELVVVQPRDVLIIVDMQNDFVPPGSFGVKDCGAFGVAEGDLVSGGIEKMIEKFGDRECDIIATRDYHPEDHVSFKTFPAHCVQGSPGANLVPPIKIALQALKDARKKNGKKGEVLIVFKGYSNVIDSFGAFPYKEEVATKRLDFDPIGAEHGICSHLSFTGGLGLKSSYQSKDLDAPPDVMAYTNDHGNKTVQMLIKGEDRSLFICGLALDYCVLDTAINARNVTPQYLNVYIVFDLARAAYIPGFGEFGIDDKKGWLQDPAGIAQKLHANGIKLIFSDKMVFQ